MNNAPIGMMDSGIGGLSVWKEVRNLLPEESVIYFADGKNCPYGGRSVEEIREFVVEAVERLLARNVKLIVLACNTATAAAIDYLRGHYDIPFVGMEPAVKPAALSSRSKIVGILATRGSLDGGLFHATSARYADKVKILTAVGEGFVELVEKSKENTQEAFERVEQVLRPLLCAGADRIVLGCTHYPFLAERMKEVIGERGVELIDPSRAVAERVKFLLERDGLSAAKGGEARCEFMTSGSAEYLAGLIAKSKMLF